MSEQRSTKNQKKRTCVFVAVLAMAGVLHLFEIKGSAEVTVTVSSTGGDNTSAFAVVDENGASLLPPPSKRRIA